MSAPDTSMPSTVDQSTNDLENHALQDRTSPTPTAAPPSRLGSILQAVAGVASTGLAGIPNTGRPSFVSGLGSGARAEQAAEATAQDIKFKTFSDQVRVATLHNQDLALQNHTQEQQDSHEDHMAKMHANDSDWGIKYDTIANDGTAVMDHMKTQTAANGSVSVPPGAHISGDGKTIMIPQDTPETAAGQLSQYKAVGPALGFTLQPPTGATKLDPKVASAFYNKLQGFDANGNIYTADKLPALIAANQSQRDDLAKKGVPQNQLDALDGIVSKQKAQLKADTDASDTAANKTLQRQKELENVKSQNKESQEDNKAANKAAGDANSEWKPKVTAMQKNKTDLAENMVSNANSVASILIRRPDLVGAVAGRYTSTQQMIGNNDKDIAALGTAIHNIAMANNGIHGMKAHEGVEDFERLTLNHFKNGPQAIAGALGESAKSVQTFIDAARPETYKTHSKNGGAIKAMVSQ